MKSTLLSLALVLVAAGAASAQVPYSNGQPIYYKGKFKARFREMLTPMYPAEMPPRAHELDPPYSYLPAQQNFRGPIVSPYSPIRYDLPPVKPIIPVVPVPGTPKVSAPRNETLPVPALPSSRPILRDTPEYLPPMPSLNPKTSGL